MAGKDHVRCRFTLARIGIKIPAHEPAGLGAYEQAPVFRLANHLVAGREVGDDRRPFAAKQAGRRIRHPKILADLHAKREGGERSAGKQLVCAERHGISEGCSRFTKPRAGGEMPPFIKLAVIGDVCFRYKAEELSFVAYGGAVVKLAAEGEGKPRQEQQIQLRGFLQNACKR